MIALLIFSIVISYLLGSISFAVIFTKLFSKKDVRNFGSGNAGSTNAMRVGGKLSGILTFVCDFLKGTLSSFIGMKLFEYISQNPVYNWALPIYGAYICGIFCMIGHIFPIFFGFKGGKCVATGAGIFIPFCPIATVIGLITFGVILALTGYVAIGSLSGTLIVAVLSICIDNSGGNIFVKSILASIIAIIIFIRHYENIVRLIKGEEDRVFRKKGKE